MAELPPFQNPPPHTQINPIGETLPTQVDSIEKPKPERLRGVKLLFGWILRWSFLGVGVGGAWFLGLLVAQFFPDSTPTPPIQEIVARRTSRFSQKVRRLPAWWAGDDRRPRRPVSRLPEKMQPLVPASRPVALSDIQREQVTVELDAVQSDLQRLRDRVSALETQLSLPTLDIALEERLGNVANRIAPPTDTTASIAPSESPAVPLQNTPQPDPLFQIDAYRVTLPSDILFAPGDAILQPNSRALLDSLLIDIAQYPGATILIGAYSDIQLGEGTMTALSYQQAIAVQRYLAQRLGENDINHWVAVGYGNTPLGVTGSGQLSRRIAIAIVP